MEGIALELLWREAILLGQGAVPPAEYELKSARPMRVQLGRPPRLDKAAVKLAEALGCRGPEGLQSIREVDSRTFGTAPGGKLMKGGRQEFRKDDGFAKTINDVIKTAWTNRAHKKIPPKNSTLPDQKNREQLVLITSATTAGSIFEILAPQSTMDRLSKTNNGIFYDFHPFG